MKLTDEEIEKGLHDLTAIDLTDKTNYDSCGRLIPPRGMMIIQAALDYINRLKAELDKANDNESYGNVKQAVQEFAETLRKKAKLLYEPNREWYENVRVNEIDDLIVELYGADE